MRLPSLTLTIKIARKGDVVAKNRSEDGVGKNLQS